MSNHTASILQGPRRFGLDVVGNSSMETGDIVEQIRNLLPQLDLGRPHHVYIRKSNARAEADRAHYLHYQEQLAEAVVAGMPEGTKVEILDEDIGISGVYDSTFRPSIRKIEDSLANPNGVGTIWVVDLARIYRDPTYVAPTILASKLSNNGVKIVHFEQGAPEIIDMATDSGRDTFIAKCQQAARQRVRLRNQTLTARQMAFRQGEWSGAPVPIGWILDPPHHTTIDERRLAVKARLRLYEPHARVKRQIWTLGARPDITTWAALRRAVHQAGLVIDPFPKALREYMATRSAMKGCIRDGHPYNPNEPLQISEAMLYNLLLDPLAMGYVMFGSGARAGNKEWQQINKRYARMRLGATEGVARPDSLVRNYRVFDRLDPSLAIDGVASQEARDLFWRLQEKWSEFDAAELRRSNFEICNLKTDRRRGRPVGSGIANHWVGKIVCGLHADDHHCLSYHSGKRADRDNPTPRWVCSRDYRLGSGDWCITLGSERGDDILTRTLDAHLLGRLQWVLSQMRDEEGEIASQDHASQTVSAQKELADLQRCLARKRRHLEADVERWSKDGWGDEEIESERRRWVADQIVPIERALRETRKRLDALLCSDLPDNAACLSAREMLPLIERIQSDWSSYSTEARKVLVDTYITSVWVIADRTPATDEVWLRVNWRSGLSDVLLAWRNPAIDKRIWTAEEDAALMRLWASDCSWDDIAAALQPGRRYNLVRRRAQVLNITHAGRSRAWRAAADFASKSYVQGHPYTFYWLHTDRGTWEERTSTGERLARAELPAGVRVPEAVDEWLHVTNYAAATSNPGKPPSRRP